MTSVLKLAGAALAGLLCAAYACAEPADMRMRLVKIMDPTGFEQPVTAATTVLPADWTTQGGVIWNINGSCSRGQTVDWVARSGDGKAFIQMMPTTGWQYNNQGFAVGQDCIAGGYNTADEYVSGFVSQLPGGKVTDVQRDPQTIQYFSQYPFAYEMAGDPYAKSWWDAATVSFDFRQEGKAYSGAMIVYTMHSYNLSGHSFGYGPPLEMGYGQAMNRILLVAPSDSIEAYLPAFLLYLKNYRVDPAWQARMNRHNSQMAKDAIESSGKISEIIAETYSDISDMSMKGWRDRNASSDRIQRETSEWIRDVETYNADTTTGQVELPTGYDRAFQMDDDTFVVTNDQFFDPINGRQLDVTQ